MRGNLVEGVTKTNDKKKAIQMEIHVRRKGFNQQ